MHRWSYLGTLTFDKRFEADGYIVCLYASMIELCGGIIALVQSDRLSALPPVFFSKHIWI